MKPSVFTLCSRLSCKGWPGILFLLLGLWSCHPEKESTVPNLPPQTVISVEKIQLNGSNRLITQLGLHWSATDADGYVRSFRISWGQDSLAALGRLQSAEPVTNTDSTFLFDFNTGSDTADIFFFVKAIDEKGMEDPTPASLRIPVINSPPDIHFLADGLAQTDTLWSVLSFPFTFSDPDGPANIKAIYIRVNDGAWVELPKSASFISLVPQSPATAGPGNGLIYLGENLATLNREPTPLSNVVVPGLEVDGNNQVYLKIEDLAGATNLDTCDRNYFIRRKTSDLLLIDAYRGEGAQIGDTVNTTLVSAVSSFDKLDLIVGGGVHQPKFWNSNFYLITRQYKKIFWYSDIYTVTPGQTPLLLTFAATSLNQYLRFNGKLLVSAIFPGGAEQLPMDDPVFSLLPVDSITKQSKDVRLRSNRPILPKVDGYDTLRTISFGSVETGVDLFMPKPGVDSLYVIPRSTVTSSYTAKLDCIALRARNPFNNQTNLVFFGIELPHLSGDRPKLQNTFNRILNQEFNW